MVTLARIVALCAALAVVALFVGPSLSFLWSGETGSGEGPPRSEPPAKSAKSESDNQQKIDPKRLLLAHERAEAERLGLIAPSTTVTVEVDLNVTPATPAEAATKRYFKVKVRDAGTLEADGTVIRLAGIETRSADATCVGEDGLNWPCGAMAKGALTRLIRYRAIVCTLPPGGEAPQMEARCKVAETDLSTWMVRRGWAEPKSDDPELASAHAEAKKERLGLWRTSAE